MLEGSRGLAPAGQGVLPSPFVLGAANTAAHVGPAQGRGAGYERWTGAGSGPNR